MSSWLFRKRDYIAVIIYAVINLIVFTCRCGQYSQWNTKIARGSAAVIYFNFVLLMINVMRVTISRVRYYSFTKWILLDRHIDVHKVSGNTIFLFSLVHVFSYSCKYLFDEYYFVKTHTWLTGVLILACLTPLCLFAQLPVRSSKRFELFYYSHYLLFPILLMMCYHAPYFVYVVGLPICGYTIDRSYRFWCTFFPGQMIRTQIFHNDKSIIIEMVIYARRFERPFSYRPGDVIYLCCPDISKLEWHPFSISSSPHETGYITVHAKVAGDWTVRLLQLSRAREDKRLGFSSSWNSFSEVNPLVYFDGPLGSCNSSMLDNVHVVLVAQGIGATPYISLLKYLSCPEIKQRHPLREIDFFWVCHDNSEFRWAQEVVSTAFVIRVNVILLTSSVNWCEQFKKVDKTISPIVYVCGSWALSEKIKFFCDQHRFVFKKENY